MKFTQVAVLEDSHAYEEALKQAANVKGTFSNTTSLSAPEVKKFVPSGCYEVT